MLMGAAQHFVKPVLRLPLVAVLLLPLLLTACASSTNAPVVDRQHHRGSAAPARQQPKRVIRPVTSGSYVVKPRDTLYSIAFRYGRDWKELAQINNIPAPYTIKPGQVIHLSGRPRTAVAQQPRPATRTTAAPAATRAPARQTAPAAQPASKPATAATKPAAQPAPTGTWQWPAEGTVVSRFSSATNLNKGIDIAGQLGQPVRATSKGTVVYAGSDLRGYGELIIIKHNDTFISAYGHNRRLLVNEGQQVNAGQQIAEMGSTGTDRVKLHFEIRRQGNPVDPLQYLPKR